MAEFDMFQDFFWHKCKREPGVHHYALGRMKPYVKLPSGKIDKASIGRMGEIQARVEKIEGKWDWLLCAGPDAGLMGNEGTMEDAMGAATKKLLCR